MKDKQTNFCLIVRGKEKQLEDIVNYVHEMPNIQIIWYKRSDLKFKVNQVYER